MDILQVIADELQIKKGQVEKSVELIDEGATIPFIARYRKEVTGSLNDEQLRALSERLVYLRNLEEKKASVLATIEEQGKLTDELKKQIEAVMTMVALEDLYRPYRPKRRTRATIAKEKGLEPLAEILRAQATTRTIEEEATAFVDAEKGVESVQDAIDGAKDILAEVYADDADYRTKLRAMTKESGSLVAKAKDEEADSVYEMYYDFSEPIKKLVGHRILAINRGEAEKFLTVKIEAPRQEILLWLVKQIIGNMKQISLVHELISKLLVHHEVLMGIGASQIISNVPAAILLSGFTDDYSALLIGVNLGGLGTLIASLASLISFKFYTNSNGNDTRRFLGIFTLYNVIFLGVLFVLSLILC